MKEFIDSIDDLATIENSLYLAAKDVFKVHAAVSDHIVNDSRASAILTLAIVMQGAKEGKR
jgi:hypothetical protein